MSLNASTASTGTDICNLFAQNFSAAYGTFPGYDPILTTHSAAKITNSYLTSIQFRDDQILKVLKRLDINKGAGSDGLPAVFVAKCAPALVRPLRLIYNKSLGTGIFPKTWKLALVVPLHKSGAKNLIKNYRPISILPIFAKVLEQLLHPILSWHVKQLIDIHQHGFIKCRSTTTNLVSFVNDISHSVDNRCSVNAVYTDFSKAFDRVSHQLLLQKLADYGVAEPLLSWCRSYLSQRESFVVAAGYSSDPYPTLSGVPQGSILGPLFFIIFINDIGKCFQHSKYYMFADDLKIFKTVSSQLDSTLLQEDLDRLVIWCRANDMDLNAAKCFSINFTKKATSSSYTYYIDNIALAEVTHIRDLGVTLDSKLKMNVHIDNICGKAFKCLGFVLRNCKQFRNPSTKILLYNSLVRSILEYCIVVWNPFYEVYSKRLESVQKRFLWHLCFSCNLAKKIRSYTERLKHFKMNSLENRRRNLDVCFLYKLANGLLDTPDLLFLLDFSAPRTLPRISRFNILGKRSCRTNLGQNAPINRMVREFSHISKNKGIDLFGCSIGGFKFAMNSSSSE